MITLEQQMFARDTEFRRLSVEATRLTGILLAGCLLIWLCKYYYKRYKSSNLPGPPRSILPFVGNWWQVQAHKGNFANLLEKWRQQYGDIYSYELFGETSIVISRWDAVKELLEHRGSIYSSRPDFPMLRTFVHRNTNIAFELYGDVWRRLRKATHAELNVRQAKQYVFIQEREAHQMALTFLNRMQNGDRDPKRLQSIATRFAGAISFGVMYDHRVRIDNDPLIVDWVHVMERKLAFFTPGSNYYDYLPWLRWLPESIMRSKHAARLAREEGEAYDQKLSAMVRDRVAKGLDGGSFHAALMESTGAGKSGLSTFEADSLSGMIVIAAIETTVATFCNIVKALVVYPEAQRKLQAEVDRVVGRSRMPTYEDLEQMVYVKAFIRETLRWREVARYGVPHCSVKDDVFEGMIPKGTVVTPFVWALSRDPTLFPDFDVLRPERYIDEQTGRLNNIPMASFGFGRRACVGQNLALTSTELAAATMAWAFQFDKERDASGQMIEVDTDTEAVHENGTIFSPLPFSFSVTLRSQDSEKIIRKTAEETF